MRLLRQLVSLNGKMIQHLIPWMSCFFNDCAVLFSDNVYFNVDIDMTLIIDVIPYTK
jgi:hypothetical protein